MPQKTKTHKKPKKKLTSAQKAEKRRRKAEFETIFVGGKQNRVRRRPLVEGLDPDEFIRRNDDPIWLHQHGIWEELEPLPDSVLCSSKTEDQNALKKPTSTEPEYDEPF